MLLNAAKCQGYWILQNYLFWLIKGNNARTHAHTQIMVKQVFVLLLHDLSINFFFWTRFFFLFPQNFLLTNSISFSFDHWIFCYSILFESFWLFLILFRMLRMLVTVNNQKHMSYHRPHASRITIQLLPKDFLVCPIKLVWHWSHASWIAIKHLQKTFANPKTQ